MTLKIFHRIDFRVIKFFAKKLLLFNKYIKFKSINDNINSMLMSRKLTKVQNML